ncbi:malolactic enzyme [Streptococcus parasanguinis]|uniref:malolactic enzyme n=1 Tax=Streptococcus parasanguinis TaxID=1318 RepID=UPI00066A9721|nr:malolactic enzyme [Streptococcus parasanguinis]
MKSHEILNNPFLNKGTAFTMEERKELGLIGLLPPYVQSIEEQAEQAYQHFLRKPSDLEKRLFLMEIFKTNRTLFYYLFNHHIVEFNPIVYDPVIADTIEQYSELFVDPQYAAYLDINHPENIEETLKNAAGDHDIRLIVATDAEGILGIGDWGVQGVDISVGKLMVYTAAAGIDPACVMPLVIDAGTNREELLNNPMYLGNRHERVRGEKYDAFIDQFVQTAGKLFPKLYLHWEDFGRSNAADILNRYKKEIPTFNDDIQGTGIVVLGGIFGAMDITGEKLTDQVYLCYGGGSAGAGIADRVHAEMVAEGLSPEEAYKRFFMIDKQGLLFDDMEDLTPAQKPFAKKRADFEGKGDMTNLLEVIKTVKPTILVGTSTNPGAFTKEVVEAMCENTERPVIFPISNPTKKLEATAQQVIEWSDGKAFVATGVPSGTISYKGVDYEIGQANNALIYPGLGLGMLASEAKLLTDEMIGAAAHSLSGIVNPGQPGAPVLPPFQYVADVSIKVAEAVAKKAQEQGLAQAKETDMAKAVRDLKWYPKY